MSFRPVPRALTAAELEAVYGYDDKRGPDRCSAASAAKDCECCPLQPKSDTIGHREVCLWAR